MFLRCILRMVSAVVLTMGLAPVPLPAQAPLGQPPQGSGRWESQIAGFEKRDLAESPPQNGILFVGSSSIRMWDLKRSFPDLPVINRGFGGSQYADAAHFVERIVLPYRPSRLVLYSGDNDIAQGKTPEQVTADLKRLIDRVQTDLPNTRIVVISIKPSRSRWKLIDTIRTTNGLIREMTASSPQLAFLDVEPAMLDKDGQPRKELFKKDGLHLNDEGYALWSSLLRPLLVAEEPERLQPATATETTVRPGPRRWRIFRRP